MINTWSFIFQPIGSKENFDGFCYWSSRQRFIDDILGDPMSQVLRRLYAGDDVVFTMAQNWTNHLYLEFFRT
jgi:hypothetical protein